MTSFTSSFAGQVLPVRSAPQHHASRGRARMMQVHSVMTGRPREDSGTLDVDEQQVNGSDAFKQLVTLSRKQSVNRPQTVGR